MKWLLWADTSRIEAHGRQLLALMGAETPAAQAVRARTLDQLDKLPLGRDVETRDVTHMGGPRI